MTLSLRRPWRRWIPLLLAVLLNAALLSVMLHSEGEGQGQASRRRLPASNTPELVRYSRSAARTQPPAAAADLEALTLPPPPVDLLPDQAAVEGPPAPPQTPRAETGANPKPSSTGQPQAAEARSAGTTAPPEAALKPANAPSRALLESLWSTARPATERPAPLVGLPAAMELRALPLNQAREAGLDDLPRTAVQSGGGIWLVWSDGHQLWLLRAPLA